jgi:hypothetical protein
MNTTTMELVSNLHSVPLSRKLLLALILSPLIPVAALTQTRVMENPFALSVAGSGTARSGALWSPRGNPAAFGDDTLRCTLLVSFMPILYAIPRFHQEGIALTIPSGSERQVGLALESIGVPGYQQIDGSVTGAMQAVAGVSVGATLGARWLAVERYGSEFTGSIELGLLASLTPSIAVGGAFGEDIGSDGEEMRLSLGFAVRSGETTILSIDAAQQLRHQPELSIAATTRPVPELTVRCGVGLGPPRIALGFGYALGRVVLEYGGAWLWPAGACSSIGAGIRL